MDINKLPLMNEGQIKALAKLLGGCGIGTDISPECVENLTTPSIRDNEGFSFLMDSILSIHI